MRGLAARRGRVSGGAPDGGEAQRAGNNGDAQLVGHGRWRRGATSHAEDGDEA